MTPEQRNKLSELLSELEDVIGEHQAMYEFFDSLNPNDVEKMLEFLTAEQKERLLSALDAVAPA